MDSPDARARRRPPTDRVVIGFVLLVMAAIALQPAFPPRQADRQSEFVWEMFSKAAPREDFVIDFGGRTETVTPSQVLEPARANIDYTVVLPAWLCEQHPAASSIVTFRNGEQIASFDCGPP